MCLINSMNNDFGRTLTLTEIWLIKTIPQNNSLFWEQNNLFENQLNKKLLFCDIMNDKD